MTSSKFLPEPGRFTVYDLDVWGQSDVTLARWLSQHCERHDKPDVIDHQSPEWEEFQPNGAHADLVRPLTEEWQTVG